MRAQPLEPIQEPRAGLLHQLAIQRSLHGLTGLSSPAGKEPGTGFGVLTEQDFVIHERDHMRADDQIVVR